MLLATAIATSTSTTTTVAITWSTTHRRFKKKKKKKPTTYHHQPLPPLATTTHHLTTITHHHYHYYHQTHGHQIHMNTHKNKNSITTITYQILIVTTKREERWIQCHDGLGDLWQRSGGERRNK